MKHGSIQSNTTVVCCYLRAGSVAVPHPAQNAGVVFSSPLPSEAYEVVLFAPGSAQALGVEAKTKSGFTVTFPAGFKGVVTYLALPAT